MSRRHQSNSSLKNFFIFLLLLIVGGFCYYNFSYLFTNKIIVPAPATASSSSISDRVISSPKTAVAPVVNDTFDIAGNTFPVIGMIGHSATGVLRIIPLHGLTTIQYEKLNFQIDTDLHLYLSKDLTNKAFIDLGLIKGSKGSISYTIPESATPNYRYVLTWSTKLHTLFNYVEIPENPI
jgi:hypothetical protein